MKTATLRDYKQRLLKVLIHIQQNLDESLSLEGLAAIACLSPHHFHRVFSGMLGESLHNHIRRLRLERAAVQLKHERYPVTEIALRAGYETHEAFTRVFRQIFGVSPSQFRQTHGSEPIIRVRSHVHYRNARQLQNFHSRKPSPQIMNVKITRLPPQRVAFIRHVGPYNEVGPTWEQLCTELGRQGLIGAEARFIGLCHDDPSVTTPANVRYDACITVDDTFKPSEDIGIQTIPGGDYAIFTHFGPYENFNKSYSKLLGEWLPRSGRELGPGSSFEVYLNTPENTEPQDLITDIHLHLQSLA